MTFNSEWYTYIYIYMCIYFTEICWPYSIVCELKHWRKIQQNELSIVTEHRNHIVLCVRKQWHVENWTWTDYKTNTQITKELKITQILDKLLEYKRNWIQHVNRMHRNRLPKVMKHYSATGRPLKRLLDTWDRNGTTSGPTAWQI